MKKLFKKILFIIVIIALIAVIWIAFQKGKFTKLEGYMYSLAAEIIEESTDCDATSSDATTSNATSSNATSSDATSSDATSSDATNNNVNNDTIRVTNTPEKQDTNRMEETKVVVETPVIEEQEGDFKYNNSEITSEIIKKIVDSDTTKNIIITIDTNSKISKEIFDAIKGTTRQLTIESGDNQIIFNGKNIVEPKEIDAKITSNLLSEDNDLKEVDKHGVVINFANNGVLPGPAIIRIKANEKMKSEISLDKIFVYYYNEENKELVKLSNEATYKNEYIEFTINHNSKYIFVNEELLDNTDSVENTDNKVTFLEGHRTYIIIIALSVIAILFVVAILILDKKTKGKAYKKQ